MEILGIDIGGSGIKGAPVDIERGTLTTKRFRVPTPERSSTAAVVECIQRIVEHFTWNGPIGCTFPSVVKHGVVLTAANIDSDWVGADGAGLIERRTGLPVTLINDADAAGLAEMRFGAGRGNDGVVIMVTLGTGIGVAIFTHGVLLPNTELGHIELNGRDAEEFASDRVRKHEDMSWRTYGQHVNVYLRRLEGLFWPDLFIIGGGASKKHEKFFSELDLRTKLVPAALLNQAGIVGAALAAAEADRAGCPIPTPDGDAG